MSVIAIIIVPAVCSVTVAPMIGASPSRSSTTPPTVPSGLVLLTATFWLSPQPIAPTRPSTNASFLMFSSAGSAPAGQHHCRRRILIGGPRARHADADPHRRARHHQPADGADDGPEPLRVAEALPLLGERLFVRRRLRLAVEPHAGGQLAREVAPAQAQLLIAAADFARRALQDQIAPHVVEPAAQQHFAAR